MSKVVSFPQTFTFEEYGDLFHKVMDICGDVELEGKEHLDATGEIMKIIIDILESKGIKQL